MSIDSAPREVPKEVPKNEAPVETPADAGAEAREAFQRSVEILREKPMNVSKAETAAEAFAKAEQIAFTDRITKQIKDGDIEGAISAMEARNKTYPGKPKGAETRAA